MSPTQRSRSVREDGNRRCMHVCPDLVSHVTRIGAVLAGTCLLLSGLAVVAVSNAAGAAGITLYATPIAQGLATCLSPANACTLSDALSTAIAGDTIDLLESGTEGDSSSYYSGGFTVDTPGTSAGAPITIQPAPAVSDPILDGGHTQDVLTVGTDVYLNLSDLTIQDGGGSSNNGAGLTNTSGGTVSVTRTTFSNNIATNDGGAIDNGDYGGGTATLTITGSTFADNISSFNGGAIDNADDDGTGVVTVSNSTFTGNTGYDGGAIDNGDRREAQSTPSTVTVTDSTFSGNTSNNDGGAIDSSDDGSGTTTISESTFSGNIAQSNGGAIDNGDLNDNYFPGGLGTLDVATSTFSGNFASSHGLTIDSGDDGGSAAATVAANVFAGSCSQAGGTWTDQGYNVGSDASCFNGGTGDNSSAGSNLANLLGPLADNGGSTETTLLLTGNPAIGIIPDPTAGLCPVAADQRGFPSPANQPCNAGSLQPGVGATYTCAVSGVLGPTSVPVVVGASPAPPSSIDAGGTFEITPAARVTIPASVINQFIGAGATSLTVASQTTTLDGRSSVGGPLSGAVQPNTESASASNLPLSDTLVANTPYTFNTTYDPVTFQTGPATGTVAVTPGDVDAEVTFVIGGTPTSESMTCTPPSGVGALGTTTVNARAATPAFQVPTATPPLQNQISAGTDGGWGATIANTSTVPVTGLSATVSVTDGGTPLTFDLAGMAASGTTCSTAGAGKLTCSIGALAEGATDTLDLLIDTAGLANGVSITGSATIDSSHAGSHSTALGAIGVVVIEAGSGAKAVATPGTPLSSTTKPLKSAKAKVSLTLPTAKIAKKASGEADGSRPLASGTTTVKPPPVAVTLESLPPSAEPALCPPTGATRCEGNIIQVVGNFSAYTNKEAPIVAVVQFFYGLRIPAGTVYFLKPNGKTVDKLSACKKTASGYDTPCLASPETHGGSAAHDSLYAQDTVYFTGNDPAMGRR